MFVKRIGAPADCIATVIRALVLLFITGTVLQAEEIRYPVACYDTGELEKVRQWENVWSGKKINGETIDNVRDFVPDSLYGIIKDRDKWGDIWFEIVAYRQILPSPGDIEFTLKGVCKLGPGGELLNHVSGVPFPNPKTGIEIAYNFDNVNQGDNMHSLQDLVMIDGKQKYDRKMVMDSHMLFYSGRREVPPVPAINPNPKRIFRATHSAYSEPASMRGTRNINIKWMDRTRPYESVTFSSNTRKTVRRSTAERTGSQGGADMCSDDNMIYDNAITNMDYKYLGRKELLLSRHQDAKKLQEGHREGYCLFNGFQRERINTYMVECIHKDPGYVYSRQVWYVDPETCWIVYAEKFDRQGNLFRTFENAQHVATSVYNGSHIASVSFITIIDVKHFHSTGGFSNITYGERNKFFNLEYFTINALQKYGY